MRSIASSNRRSRTVIANSPDLDKAISAKPSMTVTIESPAHIRLETSSFCNLRCPSCPTTTGAILPTVGGGFLRFEDFQGLLDKNPKLKRIELSNYGEIFLNPALLRILEVAYKRGIVLTADNGANLNKVRPEVLEGLVKYRLRSMCCSIDGASEATYSVYRVRGKFANAIGNIREINILKRRYRSRFPELTWQFVVFGHNEHELPLARAMARVLGMRFYAKLSWDSDVSPVSEAKAVGEATGTGAATREEYEAVHGQDYMQGICHQLWDAPQINWDGKVLGCCRNFWGDFGGNAFRDGLTASVNTEQMVHGRAMLLGRAPARKDVPCTTCEIYVKMRERGRWLERDLPPHRNWPTASGLLDRTKKLYPISRFIKAMTDYRPSIARDEHHVEALLQLGTIALERGDRAGAVGLLRRAAALRPSNPEVSRRLAEARAK
jgi:MoaA/NifB/PqqE/SkfB family radical SAM enzyme